MFSLVTKCFVSESVSTEQGQLNLELPFCSYGYAPANWPDINDVAPTF